MHSLGVSGAAAVPGHEFQVRDKGGMVPELAPSINQPRSGGVFQFENLLIGTFLPAIPMQYGNEGELHTRRSRNSLLTYIPCPLVENPSTSSGTSPLRLSKRAKDRLVCNSQMKGREASNSTDAERSVRPRRSSSPEFSPLMGYEEVRMYSAVLNQPRISSRYLTRRG